MRAAPAWRVPPIVLGTLVACAAPSADRARVEDAWVRAAGPSAAAYFTLRNPGPDTVVVVGVTTPAARSASLHETMTMGAGAAAMVHMAPLARVVVPPGASLALAPGGRHVMLEGLARPLGAGDRVPLVVRLATGDSLTADAVLRAP